MTKKSLPPVSVILLLFMLICALPPCAAEGSTMVPAPEDGALLAVLPGRWAWTDEEEGTETALDLAVDGTATLRFTDSSGVRTSIGTWAFEAVPELDDRMTLTFSGHPAECVYDAYAERWTENNALVTALILMAPQDNASSPFLDMFDYDGAALYRRQEPNMRVVRCKEFVSLRAERSASSTRLMKVPLGAQVLAFPERGQAGGFVECLYQDEFGYILAEYLAKTE